MMELLRKFPPEVTLKIIQYSQNPCLARYTYNLDIPGNFRDQLLQLSRGFLGLDYEEYEALVQEYMKGHMRKMTLFQSALALRCFATNDLVFEQHERFWFYDAIPNTYILDYVKNTSMAELTTQWSETSQMVLISALLHNRQYTKAIQLYDAIPNRSKIYGFTITLAAWWIDTAPCSQEEINKMQQIISTTDQPKTLSQNYPMLYSKFIKGWFSQGADQCAAQIHLHQKHMNPNCTEITRYYNHMIKHPWTYMNVRNFIEWIFWKEPCRDLSQSVPWIPKDYYYLLHTFIDQSLIRNFCRDPVNKCIKMSLSLPLDQRTCATDSMEYMCQFVWGNFRVKSENTNLFERMAMISKWYTEVLNTLRTHGKLDGKPLCFIEKVYLGEAAYVDSQNTFECFVFWMYSQHNQG